MMTSIATHYIQYVKRIVIIASKIILLYKKYRWLKKNVTLKRKKGPQRELMMSQRSKREMIATIHPRYLKANKVGKKQILDEFVEITGYHRKYAIRVLKHGPKPKGLKKPGRRKVYQGEVVQVLEQIWEIYGRI